MKPPFPYGIRGLFLLFSCTVCFRRVPCPLVVLYVFKDAVDVTSWILSVAPCTPALWMSGGKKRGCMRKEAILLGEIASKEMSTVICSSVPYLQLKGGETIS